jgi:16S rRNA (cytidine1402-2'-O)-methyltransferase
MATLYIVGTPIGNLEDLTFRAQKVLGEVGLICAEDTRTSRVLLDRYGITTSMIPYHDFNKNTMGPHIITQLKAGKNIALISDAGMPGIADPAFNLVREAIKQNIPVVPIPGPSALITALVCSGLPTDRFIFENFLPPKSARRKRILESFKEEPRTVIFYETPHRILSVLSDMDETMPDIQIVIGRELTKLYEEFLRGSPKSLLLHFEKKPPKGEMVVMFNMRIKAGQGPEIADDVP